MLLQSAEYCKLSPPTPPHAPCPRAPPQQSATSCHTRVCVHNFGPNNDMQQLLHPHPHPNIATIRWQFYASSLQKPKIMQFREKIPNLPEPPFTSIPAFKRKWNAVHGVQILQIVSF